MGKYKEIATAKIAVCYAEDSLRLHLDRMGNFTSAHSTFRSDTDREATAALCEAFLDEWHTYRVMLKAENGTT